MRAGARSVVARGSTFVWVRSAWPPAKLVFPQWSAPPLLPPYHAGASRSGLIGLLEEGHEGVKLSQEEMDRIACWIDLLVPYCGDYVEANAWSREEMQTYNHFLSKRREMEHIERKKIAEWMADGGRRERTPVLGALRWRRNQFGRAEASLSPGRSGQPLSKPWRDGEIAVRNLAF